MNLTTLFRAKYDDEKQKCTWTPLDTGNDELPWLDFTLQSIIPFATMILLYSHIIYTLRKMSLVVVQQNYSVKKVTIVALAASLAIIIGWLPSRISFLLSKFGYVNPGSVLHFCLVMLAFINSCVNPFLYGIYSSDFRKEYKSIFSEVVSRVGWNRSSDAKQNDVEMKARENKAAIHDSQPHTELTMKRSSLGVNIAQKIDQPL